MKRTFRDLQSKKIKVKNRNLKNQIDLNSIQVPLHNKFDVLSDMEEDETITIHQKIAPIIVTDFNINIQSFLDKLNIICDIKLMSIGRKLFPKTRDDKNKLAEALKEAKVNFFSHSDSSNRFFKAVLSGLPEMHTSEIIECLKTNHDLTPTKVVMFNTKSHNKLYLCHFDQPKMNMKRLKIVKVVHHHIIAWAPYKSKRVGPTQCFKCCMYGHGISSCNRFSVCMLCSGSHATNQCDTITPTALNPVFKCFNCASANIKHDHKANDANCPFRAKYELSRDNARRKQQQKPSIAPHTQVNSVNKPDNTHRYIMAPTPPPLIASYASIAQARSNEQIHSQKNSMPINTNTSNSNDLWTITEVTNLLLNSINELKQCNSKLDQLKVIANLLQHACT